MLASGKGLDILYVGVLPPHPGGAPISWAQLLSSLAALGHTIRALAPITPEALCNGDVYAATHPEIGVVRFPVPYFYVSPGIPPSDEYRRLKGDRVRKVLSGLIRKRRPDLLIIGRESFAPYVPDLARDHSLPCILGIRGNTTISVLSGGYPAAHAREMLDQFQKVQLLISCAHHMAHDLRTLGFDNVMVIRNAVDLGQFSPSPKSPALLRQLAIPDDAIIVVHASNLKGVKRPLDLVYSARQALQHNPRLVYVIVGDGQLRGAMEEACRQEGVRESFRFAGWVEYDRMPEYMNLADLVVMPSETEGLSRVYLEAQACGRLLLASDIPPAREVIVDGESGLLFCKGDIDELTAKTLRAAGDARLCAVIGHKAREQVKVHSLDEAVAAYAAVLRDVVDRHRILAEEYGRGHQRRDGIAARSGSGA